ncbi:hypothetical protein ACFSLT_13665 [Novosphingobium resinovorum]
MAARRMEEGSDMVSNVKRVVRAGVRGGAVVSALGLLVVSAGRRDWRRRRRRRRASMRSVLPTSRKGPRPIPNCWPNSAAP